MIFDPGDVVLKSLRLEKNPVLWRRQLAAARLAIDRALAARALGQLPDPAGIAALASSLGGDDFWGVRAAAARALGQTRRDDARDALAAAADDEHPRVRRAVAAALGDFLGDEAAARTLADRLMDAEGAQFAPLFEPLQKHRRRVIPLLTKVTRRVAGAKATESDRETLARRQANAGLALLKLGQTEPVWPLLKHSPGPEAAMLIWPSAAGNSPVGMPVG